MRLFGLEPHSLADPPTLARNEMDFPFLGFTHNLRNLDTSDAY